MRSLIRQYVEKSRQTRDVMETGCLLLTIQRFGLLDLLQDLNTVLASMIDIFKFGKKKKIFLNKKIKKQTNK